ncbi:type II toxin-antitoxin system VapC family toxin [Paucisalibacillus globulus]|uniref:type II toxin-antitoxin system VapC family toxin n=1 Tax=Paucisalibacillus globulus TaxID=351095 RepID=UPI00040FB29A|nr:PIN domain-containing protein [Paucisalibacillus globulus]
MKRNKLFIDTGAWIALMVESDQFHTKARSYLEDLDLSTKRYSSTYVIAETYTWLRYRIGFKYADSFLDIIQRSKASGALDVIICEMDILELAEQLLRDFPEQRLSYVDAVSMAIMKKEKITKVFGFDQHFYILGFEVVPI